MNAVADISGRSVGGFLVQILLYGALALGSALAGLLGQFAGVRAALWVSAVGLALCWLPIFFSPLRRMRDLPA
jgi:hypothetical protein